MLTLSWFLACHYGCQQRAALKSGGHAGVTGGGIALEEAQVSDLPTCFIVRHSSVQIARKVFNAKKALTYFKVADISSITIRVY